MEKSSVITVVHPINKHPQYFDLITHNQTPYPVEAVDFEAITDGGEFKMYITVTIATRSITAGKLVCCK